MVKLLFCLNELMEQFVSNMYTIGIKKEPEPLVMKTVVVNRRFTCPIPIFFFKSITSDTC